MYLMCVNLIKTIRKYKLFKLQGRIMSHIPTDRGIAQPLEGGRRGEFTDKLYIDTTRTMKNFQPLIKSIEIILLYVSYLCKAIWVNLGKQFNRVQQGKGLKKLRQNM